MVGYTAVVTAEGDIREGASDALVPWWSFSKTLIAACALRLVERESLQLDAPLAGKAYSLRLLLQHRAGIGNYGQLPDYRAAVARNDRPWTDAEMFARIPPKSTLLAPGDGWAYSNVGYGIVRGLIEEATGEPFGAALGRLVLAPLGLEQAHVACDRDDMARTVFATAAPYHPGWVFHGLVVGPVAEAALALQRLMTGDLLSPASRAAMLDRHAIGGPLEGRPWRATGYGLGLMMGTMQRPGMAAPLAVAGHSAGGPGSVGAVYWSSETGRATAVFMAGKDEGAPEVRALELLAAD